MSANLRQEIRSEINVGSAFLMFKFWLEKEQNAQTCVRELHRGLSVGVCEATLCCVCFFCHKVNNDEQTPVSLTRYLRRLGLITRALVQELTGLVCKWESQTSALSFSEEGYETLVTVH